MKFAYWTAIPLCLAPLSLAVAGCNFATSDKGDAAETKAVAGSSGDVAAAGPAPVGDGMLEADAVSIPEDKPRADMQLQVALDRAGFSPGIIDGKPGLSLRNALKAFQAARGSTVTGTADEASLAALAPLPAATRVVKVPADWSSAAYVPLPKDAAEQAKLPAMGYESAWERLAERFHTKAEVLQELNPGMAVPTGDVRVPNIGDTPAGSTDNAGWGATLANLGVAADQPQAARVVVDKSDGTLIAYDASDKPIFAATATMGSQHDPLPLGEWTIKGRAFNPTFHYNPKLFWDVSDSKESQKLPAGPNSPVGVVWIDLSKDHYGIHGTPHPETIGRAESHGCVRLTNWDAARLAQMVKTGTKVTFKA